MWSTPALADEWAWDRSRRRHRLTAGPHTLTDIGAHRVLPDGGEGQTRASICATPLDVRRATPALSRVRVAALALACLGVGGAVGWLLRPTVSTPAEPTADSERASDTLGASLSAGASSNGPEPERARDPRANSTPDAGRRGTGAAVGESDHRAEPARAETLRERVRALEADRRELLGTPIRREHGDSDAERFRGPNLSASLRAALTEEDVAGDVEGVDCSEFPCIVFARLEGDEEDVEELERSEALAPYASDVLTLLLWAVSADGDDGPPETALIAMAFYAVEDRAAQGDALDRRIRARVLEVWNTQRPARAGSAEPSN